MQAERKPVTRAHGGDLKMNAIRGDPDEFNAGPIHLLLCAVLSRLFGVFTGLFGEICAGMTPVSESTSLKTLSIAFTSRRTGSVVSGPET